MQPKAGECSAMGECFLQMNVCVYVQMSSRPIPVTNRRKRAQPAVSGGIPGSYDDKDSNFAW